MSLVGSIWSGRLAYALHDIASYIDILFFDWLWAYETRGALN
jgi:hypothetical protein